MLAVSLLFLAACGGGANSNAPNSGPPTGNWQFTLAGPPDPHTNFQGIPGCTLTGSASTNPLCMGGFLLQNNGAISGALTYGVQAFSNATQSFTTCNSGSAPVTGTMSGQNVTFSAVAGAQTFSFTGALSADGSTMMGTYSTTDGAGCGTTQNGLQWTATLVPTLSGSVQGSFHSTANNPSLANQDFPVTGTLTQGANIGASGATVTGTLNIQNYPCLSNTIVSVNGEISGSAVVLQVFDSSGNNIGEIGAPVGLASQNPLPVMLASASGGAVMYGPLGNGYALNTKACPLSNTPGDFGNVCLALGNATSCIEPIQLSTGTLTFTPQALGSAPTQQTVTITNTDPSGKTLKGLAIELNAFAGTPQFGNTGQNCSDFNLLPSYAASDTCGGSEKNDCTGAQATPFSLGPGKSCTVTVSFSPQESCPWLPYTPSGQSQPSLAGAAPELCPFPLAARLTINSPAGSGHDKDSTFVLPISGMGLSSLVPSVPELDFGAEGVSQTFSETSQPQTVTLTNQGSAPVQILPQPSQSPCTLQAPMFTLSRPQVPSLTPGLQIAATGSNVNPQTIMAVQANDTVEYACDIDVDGKPNFTISDNTCSGQLLPPQGTCSVNVAFSPQYASQQANQAGFDYFLELNTLQCTSTTTTDCEIDSGRFPVELKTNPPSPLRMTPGAGLDFGSQPVGQATAAPLQITLFNDPKDPNAQNITLTGNLVSGDYSEFDDCPYVLAENQSCTLNITFKPKIQGFDPGTVSVTYKPGLRQIIYLRGTGQ